MTPRPTVLYDADCGLCRWMLAKLAAWDQRQVLDLVRLQDRARTEPLLGDMDEARRMASWHLALPDGTVCSGGEAIPPLLRLLPRGRRLAGAAAAAQPLTSIAYRFVARHRSAFGRLLSVGARRRAEERLRERGA